MGLISSKALSNMNSITLYTDRIQIVSFFQKKIKKSNTVTVGKRKIMNGNKSI